MGMRRGGLYEQRERTRNEGQQAGGVWTAAKDANGRMYRRGEASSGPPVGCRRREEREREGLVAVVRRREERVRVVDEECGRGEERGGRVRLGVVR